MKKTPKDIRTKIRVQEYEITVLIRGNQEFVSLTDMARKFNERTDVIIQRWLRNRNTVEFMAIWEQLHNPNFNPTHLDGIRNELSLNSFVLSTKQWIKMTNAIGIEARAGRYGGTYAHHDIAMEFGSWLSPVFKMYLIKEFQRLKEQEAQQLNLEWDVKRIMAKATYPIHTEAVRTHLIPPNLQFSKQEGFYFANEADLLNMAVFGKTAKQWRIENPKVKGNIRDHASHEQLLVLSVIQGLNAKLLEWGSEPNDRVKLLNKAAIEWMEIILSNNSLEQLPRDDKKLLDSDEA